MRTLRSALGSLGRSPVKASVMLATVGLGVAVLIFALAISAAFARAIEERLEDRGLILMVQVDSPDPTGRNGIPAGDVPKIMGHAGARYRRGGTGEPCRIRVYESVPGRS